jgi:hypothetical protein
MQTPGVAGREALIDGIGKFQSAIAPTSSITDGWIRVAGI